MFFLRACCLAAIGIASSTESLAQTINANDSSDAALFQSPSDGGARRWQIASGQAAQLLESPGTDAGVIATLPAGTVLSNLGCARTTGHVWCEVRLFPRGRRGFVRSGRLTPAPGPDGSIPFGLDDSERRAHKRSFDANGIISCAQEQGQAFGKCNVDIARGTGGDATVVVAFTNGFSRRLYFQNGDFVSANATMSGVGTDTDWRVTEGLHSIRVDDQTYEIQDSLVFGE